MTTGKHATDNCLDNGFFEYMKALTSFQLIGLKEIVELDFSNWILPHDNNDRHKKKPISST